MSVFNLNTQNHNLDAKIVAGLERLSLAFKTLLWDKAKEYGLSPIQIQLLIFIHYHTTDKTTVSYLAKEFNITKATVSDAVKVLEQKKLIEKKGSGRDTRSYNISLTDAGIKIVQDTENYPAPFTGIVSGFDEDNKMALWNSIASLIIQLNKTDVISTQRTCPNCRYFSKTDTGFFCSLLDKPLHTTDIRIDCPEFNAS